MSVRSRRIALLTGALLMAALSHARADVADRVDWPTFLAPHDLIWKVAPDADPGHAPFLGNGAMGTLVRQTGPDVLTFLVGHAEVEDRRDQPFGRARLPVGDLHLRTVAPITGADLRLSLWDAELSGTVTTAAGAIAVRAFVHATEPVIVVEIIPTAGEAACAWTFDPAQAINPRIRVLLGNPKGAIDADMIRAATLRAEVARPLMLALPIYDAPVVGEADGTRTVVQRLDRGAHATAWRETTSGDSRRVHVTTAYQWGDPSQTREADAVALVNRVAAVPIDALVASHRAWWHAFYSKSFCSVSDPYWQSFYWAQLYKLGSAMRGDASVLDNQGPWLVATPWSGTWWNLNVQLSYRLPFSANHADLGDSLRRGLTAHRQSLIDTVPERYRHDSAAISRATAHDLVPWTPNADDTVIEPPAEIGNLTWALHNVWLHYRTTMDERILRDDLVPLLRRSVNYYLHLLTPGDDGRLHLPVTTSPEYGPRGPDTNYDLALLRWGLKTLIWADDHLKLADPLRPTWERTRDALVDYPQDADGYHIAAGVPYAKSHRHYSHLLMIYPLHLVTPENGGRDVIERCVAHWQSLPDQLLGYSFTGSASMYATLGDGERALRQLNGLKRFVRPNSMYFEAGPVLETPFAAAQSLHDMMLQSWAGPRGGVIRVFPAMPAAWRDATFADWRAEGAFLVSAARRDGRTRWVKIESRAGEPCLVRPGIARPTVRAGPAGATLKDLGDGVFAIDLKRGETVVIAPASDDALEVTPVTRTERAHVFGLPATP